MATTQENRSSANGPVKYNVGWRRVVRNFSPSYVALPSRRVELSAKMYTADGSP